MVNEENEQNRSPEAQELLDRLRRLLPEYGRRAAAFNEGSPGSVEWTAAIGEYWWAARERDDLTRYEIADRMGVSVHDVRDFEIGLDPKDNQKFPMAYANALHQPELYPRFLRQFGLELTNPVFLDYPVFVEGDENRVMELKTVKDLEWRLGRWSFFMINRISEMDSDQVTGYVRNYTPTLNLERAA